LAPKAEYLNIPVQLLSEFLDDTQSVIRNIYYYSLYAHFIKIENGTIKERYKESCHRLNFQEINREVNLIYGKVLYERYQNSPMTGIERHIYSEFNKLEKSEFDKACFLAYHALKSIVGNKTFQKADNKLLWSRMDGKVKSIEDVSELSERVRYFAQEYQTLKIKRELQENWGLIYYAQQTRGFYFSFRLELKALIREALKRKRKTVESQRLKKIKLLEEEVFNNLSKSHSSQDKNNG
ncbi:MAG: hypothetical protein WCI31_13335, partial [Prolixibacteraceae bacterium]